jgi:hypothetical protein
MGVHYNSYLVSRIPQILRVQRPLIQGVSTMCDICLPIFRFEMVVKLAGKCLSPHVYNLISHIEVSYSELKVYTQMHVHLQYHVALTFHCLNVY